MTNPFKSNKVCIQIVKDGTTYTLGVVELIECEISKAGGYESRYGKKSDGHPDNRHKKGFERMTFRIRRWFKADEANTNLLYDLHNNNTKFDLREFIPMFSAGVLLKDCMIYRYDILTGGANDIVAEEAVGEATSWETLNLCPSGEQITNGGFETGDFTGWTASANMEVVSYPDVPEGIYYALVRSGDLIGTLEQDLLNPVPSQCFTETSIFRVLVDVGCSLSPPICGTVTIDIRYTDGSKTTVVHAPGVTGWKEIDLKPYIEVGKTVKGIKLELNRESYSLGVAVDACSCLI